MVVPDQDTIVLAGFIKPFTVGICRVSQFYSHVSKGDPDSTSILTAGNFDENESRICLTK